MISYNNNKSPIRYPGGKTRACKILDKVINDYFDIRSIETIISPFFGGFNCCFIFVYSFINVY
jgi:site-specific DNA-adenine methylase